MAKLKEKYRSGNFLDLYKIYNDFNISYHEDKKVIVPFAKIRDRKIFMYPTFFKDVKKYYLSHEIAHILLGNSSSEEEEEDEANYFASQFVSPEGVLFRLKSFIDISIFPRITHFDLVKKYIEDPDAYDDNLVEELSNN